MKTEHESCSNCDLLHKQLADKEQQIQALISMTAELARHDPLTGVFNRRCLNELLAAELQRSHRTGHPFCFAIINLDNFKEVNNKYGHPAGDVVLQMVSEAAMNLLRVLDRFGRLGGEEFGIILPATWLDQGGLAMDRLAKAVAACNWEGITPGRTVTFSAGLTTNAPGDTAEAMTKRAEKAMYQAKSEGRNRIVQMEQPLPDAASL